MACVNSDIICADCFHKSPDEKCPTCSDDLLKETIVDKTLMELIQKCVSLLEIPVTDIDMEKEPFARGGFGKVHMAKWYNKDVVVKVIEANSEKEREDVKSEANITLRLNHPNVITLFGVTYVNRRQPGIVMEKAEHGSLDKWIDKINHENVTKIALGIVDGLKYVHSQKVIHRDIKPNNILMCGPKDDMIPKIADFGVAKMIQTVMMTHTMVGQNLYMAPEVRLQLRYTFAADIFSLAMTLFEMFNRQLVLHASDEIQRFITKVHYERCSTIPKNCKVPLYLREVIERGWSDKPEERPTLSEYYSTIYG